MNSKKILATTLVLAACGISSASAHDTKTAASLTADIVDQNGKKIGEVRAEEAKQGVQFQVHVSGLTPGQHGIHIHAVGKCEGPDFKSAGPHFSLADQHHGIHNTKGAHPHLGDLANLDVKKDGTAHAKFVDKSVTLGSGKNSLKKEGGTSLVIHAAKDDMKSDPSGNSGDRIACAVLSK
jgi:Cu-Zn family superoxide dismutase